MFCLEYGGQSDRFTRKSEGDIQSLQIKTDKAKDHVVAIRARYNMLAFRDIKDIIISQVWT